MSTAIIYGSNTGVGQVVADDLKEILGERVDDVLNIAEIKASDWDVMTDAAVRRNVKRQARQIWAYIESQLSEGHDVSPGMIFPRRPTSEARLRLIEQLFEDDGLPVVWEDESIEERKKRD